MTNFAERNRVVLRLARRSMIAFAVLALGLAAGGAHAAPDLAQRIAQHFSSVRTMTGEFVQFGPRGEQTGGKFYIERPGKIRFDYEPPAQFRVTSDGTSVVLENKKMNTVDIYRLADTPLKLLLGERIDLSSENVREVKQEPDLTTVRLVDRQLGNNSTITMMFDSNTYDLRQWTITDAQGRDTTVMIFNVQQGVTFDPSVFHIDYRRVNALARGGR
ncbi:outer membrane lipoprotein carrier protein LolA [Chelativorans sp. AA-79]|uniref:outer membrane lipoprotein carrier protein LolA n=1 Tax=Chelativorans sp. AA-79 TaxID=3028735 RepID=UPI0023F92337|nr:outer membrane lipoprotein carrier protein LolA [Chelativorans sp. AA-79]WEX09932.1 outer membrane lipoprotein carrier protein LolA [Chelativorans sp. AA-79]